MEQSCGVRNTHRVRTVHFGEVGRAIGEGKGSLGSDPHGARFAVRMADGACCSAHDEGIWNTAKVLLDVHPEGETQQLATLPMRMGGLGLRSAVRCAPAAFWASWADVLDMISERIPDVANDVVRKLTGWMPPRIARCSKRA